MGRFILTEDTQLVREMEVHAAAKEMAHRLGISGQIETRVGDFRQKGWTTGFVGKPGGHDVLLEVYVIPLNDDTLAMETENLVLRAALNSKAGPSAADEALEAHRATYRKNAAIFDEASQ